MSVLYLVRHGQATVEGDDYDQLSAIGAEQSNALGNFWIGRGLSFDRVLVGPRRRHRQTMTRSRRSIRTAEPAGPSPSRGQSSTSTTASSSSNATGRGSRRRSWRTCRAKLGWCAI